MYVAISWPRYILFSAVSLFTTFVGAQCVHMYYKPLDDFEDLIQQELEKRRMASE